jgi:hypothetical protein
MKKPLFVFLVFIFQMILFISCGTSEKTSYSPDNSYYEVTRSKAKERKAKITKESWIYYQDDEVTEYICPYCESREIMEVVSKRGFNTKKAIIGDILFGPAIGVLAGTSGQNKIQITLKCRRCGESYTF